MEMKKGAGYFYFAFRVIVGLVFMMHGAQKLFGAFGGINGQSVNVVSLFGLAGIIEFFGGILIAIGLFTKIVAAIGGIEMIVAYFRVHIPNGFIPLTNGGEPAVLFFASFLVIFVLGAKKWGLDSIIFGK